MSRHLRARFDIRRDAEMTLERQAQEFAIERTDIFVAADWAAEAPASKKPDPTPQPVSRRQNAALMQRWRSVAVSVDIADDVLADAVRAAFDAFDATAVDADPWHGHHARAAVHDALDRSTGVGTVIGFGNLPTSASLFIQRVGRTNCATFRLYPDQGR